MAHKCSRQGRQILFPCRSTEVAGSRDSREAGKGSSKDCSSPCCSLSQHQNTAAEVEEDSMAGYQDRPARTAVAGDRPAVVDHKIVAALGHSCNTAAEGHSSRGSGDRRHTDLAPHPSQEAQFPPCLQGVPFEVHPQEAAVY